MHFSNFSVRAKLGLAFGALSVMVVLVAGLALADLSRSDKRFSHYVNGINARALVAAQVRSAVDRRAVAVRNAVLATTPADGEREIGVARRAHADVGANLQKLHSMIAADPSVTETARGLAKEIQRVEDVYRPVALDIVKLAADNRRDEAASHINNKCKPLLDELVRASNAYADYTARRSSELIEAAQAEYASQRNLLVGLCVGAIALSILAGLLITKDIVRALGAEPGALGEAALRVAQGDLSPVDGARHAQDDSVLASLSKMQASLVQVVGQVRTSSDSIATGASQIATGNLDLSQRTEEQASSLQQTAASMDQLRSAVQRNAEAAHHADNLATEAAQSASSGGQIVDQVVLTMRGISDSSRKISEIISVIDGIAFQTNILALNAAVEAARAGEQGRGFAVVASEVRTLAQRSATAAKEIRTLIADSVERVESGTHQVDQAGRAINGIVQQIQHVSTLLADIARATAQQSGGISQIGGAVSQLDQTTQQNAALVEQGAAAAESLRIQSVQLAETVATFRLPGWA